MSARRRRLAAGIDLARFAGNVVLSWRDEFRKLGFLVILRLSYRSTSAHGVMDLERYVLSDRPHFLLQGELASLDEVPSFMAAGSRFTANFVMSSGSYLLTMARDLQGLRSLSLASMGSRQVSVPGVLEEHVIPLVLRAGAFESQKGALELDEEVRLEAWRGDGERLYLRERRPSRLPETISEALFAGLKDSARVLVSPKSWIGDVRSWLRVGAVVPVMELEPLVAYELEVGDWRTNIEEGGLPDLGKKLAQDLPNSDGVLELVALRASERGTEPVVSIHLSWSHGKTDLAWVPISSSARDLSQVWRAFVEFSHL